MNAPLDDKFPMTTGLDYFLMHIHLDLDYNSVDCSKVLGKCSLIF